MALKIKMLCTRTQKTLEKKHKSIPMTSSCSSRTSLNKSVDCVYLSSYKKKVFLLLYSPVCTRFARKIGFIFPFRHQVRHRSPLLSQFSLSLLNGEDHL